MFDWITFLNAHHIEWTDRGPSATKGNAAIRCPWCGAADPSTHLAISLTGKGYRCFRTKGHSGRSPVRLIQALLGCSYDEARRLAGIQSADTSFHDRDLAARVKATLNPAAEEAADAHKLRFLPEFRPLLPRTPAAEPFVEYLRGRDYTVTEIIDLQAEYGLCYALTGAFKWRVIFPVHYDRRLVTWTGRSIGRSDLRYRTLSANPDVAKESRLPQAVRSIERCLWNYGAVALGGHELLICEGPFDAMRLDYLGNGQRRATCVFTKNVSDEQVRLLEEVRDRYERLSLVLDNDSRLDVISVRDRLAHLDCGIRRIPRGYKDPAELPVSVATKFLEETP